MGIYHLVGCYKVFKPEKSGLIATWVGCSGFRR